nr:unnamed protein product [Sorex araneus]
MTSEEKKERAISMMNEASSYNLTSDYGTHPMSPVGRTSRASKKVHNFGKRSNSIKRNPNAPVVRRGWLYKQDSSGMRLWKKRWFVLSDLCLFYYRDQSSNGNKKSVGNLLSAAKTVKVFQCLKPSGDPNRRRGPEAEKGIQPALLFGVSHVYVADRRSMPAGLPLQSVSPQSLQGKTNEILSHHLQRNTIYLDHQMKENEPIITMVHTMIENSALRPQLYQQFLRQKNKISLYCLSQDECRGTLYKYRPEEIDIDAKLSRLCEQDKVVRALEEKLQQLHKEKYTLEQALLSASQEIEMNADNPAAVQTVVLQRDDLQNGLLSTCRELSRATAELERAWREYDKLEYDVTVTRNQMQEQLDRLGEVQTESAGIQRAQIQKELWRIEDVVEGLSKHKQQRGIAEIGMIGPKPFSTVKYKTEEEEVVPPRPPLPRSYDFTEQPPIVPPLPSDSSSLLCYSRGPVHLPEDKKSHQVQGYPRNGSHCGPDYRLYKSEPELTTVAEVDESNGEEKSEPVSEMETSVKGSHFPVGVVPPRTKSPTPESSTIASYVTLRKTKKMPDSRTNVKAFSVPFCNQMAWKIQYPNPNKV